MICIWLSTIVVLLFVRCVVCFVYDVCTCLLYDLCMDLCYLRLMSVLAFIRFVFDVCMMFTIVYDLFIVFYRVSMMSGCCV